MGNASGQLIGCWWLQIFGVGKWKQAKFNPLMGQRRMGGWIPTHRELVRVQHKTNEHMYGHQNCKILIILWKIIHRTNDRPKQASLINFPVVGACRFCPDLIHGFASGQRRLELLSSTHFGIETPKGSSPQAWNPKISNLQIQNPKLAAS